MRNFILVITFKIHTRTGCTMETSFRDGAGWYFGTSSPPVVGGKCRVEPSAASPLLRKARDKLDDMETL